MDKWCQLPFPEPPLACTNDVDCVSEGKPCINGLCIDPATENYDPIIDRARGVTVDTGGGRMSSFPVNQFVVEIADGRTRADALALATAIGGQVVGQNLELRLYQIQVPATTVVDLDAKIAEARAHAGAAAAYRSVLMQPNGGAIRRIACPDHGMHGNYEGSYRCPYAETMWYPMYNVIKAIRGAITWHPVRVAVVDTGFDPDRWPPSGASPTVIDMLQYRNGDGSISRPSFQVHSGYYGRHGQAVAEVVTGEGRGMATLLGNHLTLLIADKNDPIGISNVIHRAANEYHANVVNSACRETPIFVIARSETVASEAKQTPWDRHGVPGGRLAAWLRNPV